MNKEAMDNVRTVLKGIKSPLALLSDGAIFERLEMFDLGYMAQYPTALDCAENIEQLRLCFANLTIVDVGEGEGGGNDLPRPIFPDTLIDSTLPDSGNGRCPEEQPADTSLPLELQEEIPMAFEPCVEPEVVSVSEELGADLRKPGSVPPLLVNDEGEKAECAGSNVRASRKKRGWQKGKKIALRLAKIAALIAIVCGPMVVVGYFSIPSEAILPEVANKSAVVVQQAPTPPAQQSEVPDWLEQRRRHAERSRKLVGTIAAVNSPTAQDSGTDAIEPANAPSEDVLSATP